MNQTYLDTARLLTQIAPFVFADGTFALKGGTAINLFIRDMPRLSVDLDLVFTDHRLPRDAALTRINDAIRRSAKRLNDRGFQTHAPATADAGETKLLVRRGKIEVKVEVNFVMRGTVQPVRTAALTLAARNTLLTELEIPVVSLEDLYGGKLVATMDRQHPRDLFDVMQLFAHEGITPAIRRAFVVYLASHSPRVNAWFGNCTAAWMPMSAAFCCHSSTCNPNGPRWASCMPSVCRAFAGSCRTLPN